MWFIALPTWLWTKLIRFTFPDMHPWSREQMPQFYSLRNWAENETDLCRHFDYVLWSGIPVVFGLIWAYTQL